MRVSLAALAPNHNSRSYDIPVAVQVRPSRGMLGEHNYTTDSSTLRSMLKRQTDLSGLAIERFMTELRSSSTARLATPHAARSSLCASGNTLALTKNSRKKSTSLGKDARYKGE